MQPETNGHPSAAPERVLITGASSGIGLATARAFARRGARVAMLARSEPGLAAGAQSVSEAGDDPLLLAADVTDRDALSSALQKAQAAFGGLDVVVHAAAAAAYGTFEETDPEDFDRTVNLVLVGAANVIRAALPPLEQTGGSLIVVGSVAGRIPLPMLGAYSAGKHGLRGLIDVLRLELGERGSRVNLSLVSPGPVDTPFWDNVASQAELLPPPIPGSYRPEEVARAVLESVDGRRAGRTVGGLMLVAQTAHSLAGPVSERLLRLGIGYARRVGARGQGAAAIRGAAGTGATRSGLPAARPSLYVRGVEAVGTAIAAVRGGAA